MNTPGSVGEHGACRAILQFDLLLLLLLLFRPWPLLAHAMGCDNNGGGRGGGGGRPISAPSVSFIVCHQDALFFRSYFSLALSSHTLEGL